MSHIIDGLRVTMCCDQGHQETFEVAAFAPWIPVHCPQCPWQTPWRQVGETESFAMNIAGGE